jgi:hypothetical protein
MKDFVSSLHFEDCKIFKVEAGCPCFGEKDALFFLGGR